MSNSQESDRRPAAFDMILAVAICAAVLVLIWTAVRARAASRDVRSAHQEAPLPSEPVSLDGAFLLGSPSATLILLIFSDFECPYCAKFGREILPEIRQHYTETGKVQIGFWNYPLPMHPNARGAAAAAECSADQGHFWRFHDQLFRGITSLSPDNVIASAVRIGLDRASFESCLGDQRTVVRVNTDLHLGAEIGVMGTPAMFIGKRQADGRVLLTDRLSGARPFVDFKAAFDKRSRR